jgi:hypothetical protein
MGKAPVFYPTNSGVSAPEGMKLGTGKVIIRIKYPTSHVRDAED